jgi:hypothetical protein
MPSGNCQCEGGSHKPVGRSSRRCIAIWARCWRCRCRRSRRRRSSPDASTQRSSATAMRPSAASGHGVRAADDVSCPSRNATKRAPATIAIEGDPVLPTENTKDRTAGDGLDLRRRSFRIGLQRSWGARVRRRRWTHRSRTAAELRRHGLRRPQRLKKLRSEASGGVCLM